MIAASTARSQIARVLEIILLANCALRIIGATDNSNAVDYAPPTETR